MGRVTAQRRPPPLRCLRSDRSTELVTHGSPPSICVDLPAVAHVNAYHSAKLLFLFCVAEGNRRGVQAAGSAVRSRATERLGRSVSREMTATAPALELAPSLSVFAVLQDQRISRRQRVPREGGNKGAQAPCKHGCADRAPHCQSRRALRVPQQQQHNQLAAKRHQRALGTWLAGKLRQVLCCCC